MGSQLRPVTSQSQRHAADVDDVIDQPVIPEYSLDGLHSSTEGVDG